MIPRIVLLAMLLTVAPSVSAFVPAEMRSSMRAWNTIASTRTVRSQSPPDRSSSALAYSNEVTVEKDEQASEFQQRVRELTLEPKTTPQRHMQRRPANVKMIETLSEFKEEVGDEKERLVVVRFYADWCRACRAVEPLFYRLARDYPDIKFVEIPVTGDNATLHQGFNVPSLPYCHMYHPDVGLVEELRMNRKEFGAVAAVVQAYVKGSCVMEYDDEEEDDDFYDDNYAFLQEEW